MSMNVRTLQRRLAVDGVQFRSLLDDCRRQLAMRDLKKGNLTLSQIALSLGYSDPAHFTRAFKRWTSQSPSQYRDPAL
ncbi:MAG: helix-turn-helix transcriptional regulator [Pseudomonadales bacterium]